MRQAFPLHSLQLGEQDFVCLRVGSIGVQKHAAGFQVLGSAGSAQQIQHLKNLIKPRITEILIPYVRHWIPCLLLRTHHSRLSSEIGIHIHNLHTVVQPVRSDVRLYLCTMSIELTSAASRSASEVALRSFAHFLHNGGDRTGGTGSGTESLGKLTPHSLQRTMFFRGGEALRTLQRCVADLLSNLISATPSKITKFCISQGLLR